MTGWNLFKFAFGFMWELIWVRGEVTYKFHIPPCELKRMHREVQQELDLQAVANSITGEKSTSENPPTKVSEMDVLQAWITKGVFSSSRHLNALISVVFACNMRPRFPEIFSQWATSTVNSSSHKHPHHPTSITPPSQSFYTPASPLAKSNRCPSQPSPPTFASQSSKQPPEKAAPPPQSS